MSFIPFTYEGWVMKLDWGHGKLTADDKTVHDGDTGYALLDCGRRRYDNTPFRLWGVNAYELNDTDPAKRELAQYGRDFLRGRILGKLVYIRSFKYDEKFGRILTIIWEKKEDFNQNILSVNAALVAAGLAVPYMGELL